MTVATLNERSTRHENTPAVEAEAPVVHPHVAEAPDLGEATLPHEAPEAVIQRHAEAPDHDSGRSFIWESEFTHGRSRS